MKFQKHFDKILCTRDDKHSGDKNQHIYETEE